jgi:hypothetical protein
VDVLDVEEVDVAIELIDVGILEVTELIMEERLDNPVVRLFKLLVRLASPLVRFILDVVNDEDPVVVAGDDPPYVIV